MFSKIFLNFIYLLIFCWQRFISPFIGQHCRFYPSCSSYAKSALEEYGLIRGTILSIKRILRCNRFFCGGYDPVPKKSPH